MGGEFLQRDVRSGHIGIVQNLANGGVQSDLSALHRLPKKLGSESFTHRPDFKLRILVRTKSSELHCTITIDDRRGKVVRTLWRVLREVTSELGVARCCLRYWDVFGAKSQACYKD